MSNLLYPLHNEVVGGYIGFTPSVCPSVRPASRVRSVAPNVVVGSISYLYILSSNFRRCVACRVSYQIRIFGNFLKLVTLPLPCCREALRDIHMGHPVSMSNLLYPLHNEVVGGYIGFTPSVCPSVRPASRVRSVAPKVVVGSISYLYILSSNFRRCVACRVSYQIRIFGNFLKLVTLPLPCCREAL